MADRGGGVSVICVRAVDGALVPGVVAVVPEVVAGVPVVLSLGGAAGLVDSDAGADGPRLGYSIARGGAPAGRTGAGTAGVAAADRCTGAEGARRLMTSASPTKPTATAATP